PALATLQNFNFHESMTGETRGRRNRKAVASRRGPSHAPSNVLHIWKRSPGISPACARACLGSPFETSESHCPDLGAASTPAWTAPLIFKPKCLTVLGPCAC